MKHVPSATSSDLERARELSRRLRPGESPDEPHARAHAVPPGPGAFVRFRAADVVKVAAGPVAAPPPLPPPETAKRSAPASPQGGGRWDESLEWCRGRTGARSAFALDGQGLLIASSGALASEEAEGIGSRMMLALDQARKMADTPPARLSVGFDLGGDRLSGFAVTLGDGTPVTFGLVGPQTPDPLSRAVLEEAFDAGT
jgi:hypothetical protein